MSRTQKIHCKWGGCPFSSWDATSIQEHEALEHVECVCHRHFLKDTIYRHRHGCSVYRAAQLEVEQIEPLRCSGCMRLICEGQHYLLIPTLILKTMMPADHIPARNEPDTEIKDIAFCTPDCLMILVQSSELLRDMFRGWLEDQRQHEMIVYGRHFYYSLSRAANTYANNRYRTAFGGSVCEPGGFYRDMTIQDRRCILRKADEISVGR